MPPSATGWHKELLPQMWSGKGDDGMRVLTFNVLADALAESGGFILHGADRWDIPREKGQPAFTAAQRVWMASQPGGRRPPRG